MHWSTEKRRLGDEAEVIDKVIGGSPEPDRARRSWSTPLWVRALEYWITASRRTWRTAAVFSVVYPVLYLAAMGVGLGGLIDHHVGLHATGLGGVPYLVFVAPGIFAGSAMQIGVQESTYPVMGAIRWQHTYHAMLATPLSVFDVLRGHVAFIGLRLLLSASIFFAVIVGFGAERSPEALLEVLAGVLTGIAFALPVMAFSVSQEDDAGFPTLNRLVVIPLFLFSGSFFPIHQLPGVLQLIAELTPLYHGVALCRACALGHVASIDLLGHVCYLLGLATFGWLGASVAYRRRLAL